MFGDVVIGGSYMRRMDILCVPCEGGQGKAVVLCKAEFGRKPVRDR